MSIESQQAIAACDVLSQQVVTIEEYRKLLKDKRSTKEEIQRRIEYVESFCRAIIRIQLEEYAKRT